MSRFILMPFGSAGDVFPFLWMGGILRRAGHDVTMIGSAYFEEAARKKGLDFRSLGTKEDFLRIASHPDLWHPLRAGPYVFQHCAKGFADYYQAALACEPKAADVVVCSALAMAGDALKMKFGCRLVKVHLQPSVLMSFEELPELGPAFAWMRLLPKWFLRWSFESSSNPINRYMDPVMREVCRAENLTPPPHAYPHWWHSKDGTLALFPEWFSAHPSDWPKPLTLTDFPLYDLADQVQLDPALEQFLKEGEPPIVMTAGSAMMYGEKFFKTAVAACEQLGVRAVFVAKYDGQVPSPLPPGMMHVRFVPFSSILPRASLFVSHGGIGTVSQGLAAGVPQLVVALAHDQPDNGNRLRRLGAGDWMMSGDWTQANAVRMISRLLSTPSVREAARRCAGRIPPASQREQAMLQILTQQLST